MRNSVIKQRILVISSCGKAKATTSLSQPICGQLQTKFQREKAVSQFQEGLTTARDLYTGLQAQSIAKAVDLLRKSHIVDYYIISAGFGLVKEDTLLPPYDCTFSGKTKDEIHTLSNNLEIQPSLFKLVSSNYNLVYLALGQDYLTALGDISQFESLGEIIILFGRKLKNLAGNFHIYNEQTFVQNPSSINVFAESIGATIAAKGNILLNYSYDLLEGNKTIDRLPFDDWWENKNHLLSTQKKSIEEDKIPTKFNFN